MFFYCLSVCLSIYLCQCLIIFPIILLSSLHTEDRLCKKEMLGKTVVISDNTSLSACSLVTVSQYGHMTQPGRGKHSNSELGKSESENGDLGKDELEIGESGPCPAGM